MWRTGARARACLSHLGDKVKVIFYSFGAGEEVSPALMIERHRLQLVKSLSWRLRH